VIGRTASLALRARFGRFLLVGIICALLDTSLVWLLDRAQIFYGVAITAGFLAGLVLNYVLHARFTFSVAQMGVAQLARFLVVVGLNYGITLLVVYLLYGIFSADLVAAKIVALPLVAVNGYWLSRVWVFRPD